LYQNAALSAQTELKTAIQRPFCTLYTFYTANIKERRRGSTSHTLIYLCKPTFSFASGTKTWQLTINENLYLEYYDFRNNAA